MKLARNLPDLLLPWYEANKRDLPWRHSGDPYHIWLSEIMLQQTRVEAVKGYYARFLTHLPTIGDLAACEDEKLHKLWEGLGYYSRVRNLKKAANVIMTQFGGVFPTEYADVISLPGIGAYTAGAICSIAFNRKTPAVDGNVLRVYARLMNDPTPIDKPSFRKKVQEELADVYPTQAGAFTQALMELGATLCGPNRAPECGQCPLKEICAGYRMGTAASLPVRPEKKEKRVEHLTVFILHCDGAYALEKRPPTGLLAGLWQFPNVPGTLELADAIDALSQLGLSVKGVCRQVERQHIFTHIRWEMRGFYLDVGEKTEMYCWMTPEEIQKTAALPTAMRQFWEEIENV